MLCMGFFVYVFYLLLPNSYYHYEVPCICYVESKIARLILTFIYATSLRLSYSNIDKITSRSCTTCLQNVSNYRWFYKCRFKGPRTCKLQKRNLRHWFFHVS